MAVSLFLRDPVTIEEEFERNPELTKEALKHLNEWLKTKAYLPTFSESRLALFLHSCHYDLEKAKIALEKNVELRSKWSEVFSNRDPYLMTNKSSFVYLLPLPTKEGYRVLGMINIKKDPSEFNLDETLKLIWMTADILDHFEGTNKGLILLMDSSNMSFGLLRKLTLSSIRKAAYHMDFCMPVRMKALHYVNVNSILRKCLGIITPFLKGGYEETMFLHSDMESLHSFLPKEILPIEYGGPEFSISQMSEMTEELRLKGRSWFELEETMRIDETLRPKQASGFFSFKWLGF